MGSVGGDAQQRTMDKGVSPVSQLPDTPPPGRIRHTTAEWGTARGSQHPARAQDDPEQMGGEGPRPPHLCRFPEWKDPPI